MSLFKKNTFLALAVLCSALPFAAGQAEAKSNFMEECSAKWKAAKANNQVPDGMKWPEFMKTQCASADDAAAQAAPESAAPAAKAKTPAKAGKTVTTSPASPAPATKVPAAKAPAAEADDETPPEPSNKADAASPTTDKNGKPYTEGQIAAHKRIKQCGQLWSAAKAAGKVPAGQKWPQYWSACNKRLKAQGQ